MSPHQFVWLTWPGCHHHLPYHFVVKFVSLYVPMYGFLLFSLAALKKGLPDNLENTDTFPYTLAAAMVEHLVSASLNYLLISWICSCLQSWFLWQISSSLHCFLFLTIHLLNIFHNFVPHNRNYVFNIATPVATSRLLLFSCHFLFFYFSQDSLACFQAGVCSIFKVQDIYDFFGSD